MTTTPSTPLAPPATTDLARLAELLRAHAPYDALFELRVPGVNAVRGSRTSTALAHSVQRPGLCIVAQGAKRVFVGADVYDYDPAHLLVYSVDLPVASMVTQASFAEPFLCLRLDLDPAKLAALTLKVYPSGLPKVRETRGVQVGAADAHIVNAAVRLMEVMDEPHAPFIAPLVVEEIMVRLLSGPLGHHVAQIGQAESGLTRVSKAVDWVQAHFDQPMNVEALAEMVHMSPSSFHAHFKTVTSMSPLQYQKVLRLQAARRLMLSSTVDAATASRQVGYASASQFSREYARLFGNAPSRDMAQLREHPMPN